MLLKFIQIIKITTLKSIYIYIYIKGLDYGDNFLLWPKIPSSHLPLSWPSQNYIIMYTSYNKQGIVQQLHRNGNLLQQCNNCETRRRFCEERDGWCLLSSMYAMIFMQEITKVSQYFNI